jgi:hypothetical protein
MWVKWRTTIELEANDGDLFDREKEWHVDDNESHY